MRMSPLLVLLGSTLVLLSVTIGIVIVPSYSFQPKPSANAHPYTKLELEGRDVYIQNGCVYCHSQSTRSMDWGMGSGEAAVAGDYAYDSPHLIGSERNGPDLFREGGYHPDDWHVAHFINPRYTRPQSFMPSFKFLTNHQLTALIAYIQCLGGKEGLARARQQDELKQLLIKYYMKGPAENVAYLNSTFPSSWLKMPNPVPVTIGSVERGRVIYVAYCSGCHGDHGDGRGPAKRFLNPPPMDFTLLQASGANPQPGEPGYHYNFRRNEVSAINNGAIYYAVLYGIPGSAMPQFKGQLESEKIWDVGNYVGWAFMGWKLEPYDGRYEELSKARPSGSRVELRRTVVASRGASDGG